MLELCCYDKRVRVVEIVIPSTSADFTEDKRQKILEWVSEVRCEDHHAEVVKTRLEGTGSWLLQRQEIQSWLESEESSVLWLHGKGNICDTPVLLEHGLTLSPAGSGKTVLR